MIAAKRERLRMLETSYVDRPAAGDKAEEIRPVQRRAMYALLAGFTISEAAEAAGVHRSTLHRWLRDETFRTVMAENRHDLLRSVRARLESIAEEAASVVEDEVNEGNSALAIKLLRELGVFHPALKALPEPPSPAMDALAGRQERPGPRAEGGDGVAAGRNGDGCVATGAHNRNGGVAGETKSVAECRVEKSGSEAAPREKPHNRDGYATREPKSVAKCRTGEGGSEAALGKGEHNRDGYATEKDAIRLLGQLMGMDAESAAGLTPELLELMSRELKIE